MIETKGTKFEFWRSHQLSKVLKLRDVVSYLLAYNQNLELLVGLEHTLHIDLIRSAIQPQVPPWECSRLNPNNSLVRSSRVSLLENFELLVRTSGELSVDSAPAIGKVLARGDSSRIEAEENVVEDGGLE